MSRPYVLTIAGHDPSGGAGLTADCKVFEQLRAIGLSVCTAITVQTDCEFQSVTWVENELIIEQTKCLVKRFKPSFVKVGLIPSFSLLKELVELIRSEKINAQIIWDPILSSSTGFTFHESNQYTTEFLKGIDLITPNAVEAKLLFDSSEIDVLQGICRRKDANSILFKGGHSDTDKGVDFLISAESMVRITPFTTKKVYAKHGTGCMLSAAIAASLATNESMEESCRMAKQYVEKVMASNTDLLAWHC